jgi:hypothetical protein
MKTTHILIIFATMLIVNSCKKFDELEKNPNVPSQVPASLVLRGILVDMYEGTWGTNKNQRWNQYYTINYNYYGTNEYDWTSTEFRYTTLKNVGKMEEEAKKQIGKDLNPYSALGKFFRAYYYVWMTQRVGDLPLTEALQGTGNITPKYNAQKDIYVQALKWLDEANDDLAKLAAAGDNTLQGDIYLGNDLRKWQKVVNTFKLRVLISLSKRADDTPELSVKSRFAEVVNNPAKFPVMTSAADNLQYTYNATFNKYPINPDNFGFDATRQQMSATHIDLLKQLNDARLFVVAEPAEVQLKKGIQPTDYAAYIGASPAESLDDMSSKAGRGEYSFINRARYYRGYTPEPTVIIGYPELQFTIAEGINRGWVSGNAEDFYKKGVQASFDFFGVKNGDNAVTLELRDAGKATSQGFTVKFDYNAYFAQPAVKYAGNTTEGLRQILTQKYLAMFMNTGLEPFFNWRRTGYPANFAKGGPGTGNSGVIPRRWQYPASERVYNATNYAEALKRQFNDDKRDNINDELWLLK